MSSHSLKARTWAAGAGAGPYGGTILSSSSSSVRLVYGPFNRWVRAHPAAACALSTCTLLLVLLVAGVFEALSSSYTHTTDTFVESTRRFLRESRAASNITLAHICTNNNNNDQSKLVLVTGAAGFVGYHAAVALRGAGVRVVGLDNFNDYYAVGLKRKRAEMLAPRGVYIAEGDLNDADLLRTLFDTCAFTHVLHLAAQAGVRYAVKNPQAYIKSNVAGTPALVFASSSSVYGLNTKVPFSEEDRTDRPTSLYAATKLEDELLVHTYSHIYGLSAIGLRPDMAYFSFTKAILEQQPIKVFRTASGGELLRDFTYVDDVVAGILSAIDKVPKSGKTGDKGYTRIYNIGNTKPVTVTQLVRTIETHVDEPATIEYVTMDDTGDVEFTHANITRAHTELGYEPKTDLFSGLKQFTAWYRGYYQEETLRSVRQTGTVLSVEGTRASADGTQSR
eukprot:jgi/Chlat1/5399/Chrsp35S05307